jgi:hypothetical protein
MEDYPMSPTMKSLQLTTMPARSVHNPVIARRNKIIEKLEEQKALAADPSYVRKSSHWRGKGEDRKIVEQVQKVRPWFRVDATGQMVLGVLMGGKPLDLDGQGHHGVVVADRSKLGMTIDQVIQALQEGDLDEAIGKAAKVAPPKVQAPVQVKKAAKPARA